MKSKAYTRTGDTGETGLYGGPRISKATIRTSAFGDIDELNSFLGVAHAECKEFKIKEIIEQTQQELFVLGADLATPLAVKVQKIKRIKKEYVDNLEKITDKFNDELETLKNFILPGGSLLAARLHVARAVCRRAERTVVSLSQQEDINPEAIRYLNRLSSLLFVLARTANMKEGFKDHEVKSLE